MRWYCRPYRRMIRTYPTYRDSSNNRLWKKYLKHTSYDPSRVVQYLIDTIPSDTWEEIETTIHKSKDLWDIEIHFGFGMYVRNLLYESEIPLPDLGLDSCWGFFLETAMRKRRIRMKSAQ